MSVLEGKAALVTGGGSGLGRASAIALARDTFPRYSFDLIYARPGQSVMAWEEELGEALTLAGSHLSLYQLTIEAGTAFGNRAERGENLVADEDTAATLFELTQERLIAAGMPAYEISNHARPGAECLLHQRQRFGDLLPIPAVAVLLFQNHQIAGFVETRIAPCVLQQHQGQNPGHFRRRLGRHQSSH